MSMSDSSRYKKKRRLEELPVEESTLPASDNVATAATARQVEQPQEVQQGQQQKRKRKRKRRRKHQGQQQQQQEDQCEDSEVEQDNQEGHQSEVENEMDDIKNQAIANSDGTISKIEKEIEQINQVIEKINNKTSVLDHWIQVAEDTLAASPNLSHETLFQTFPFIKSVINPTASTDEQEDRLRKYIEERNKERDDYVKQRVAQKQRLVDKERLLMMMNVETGIKTTPAKKCLLESGLRHVQETLRLEFKDRGHINIGLIEKNMNNTRALRLRDDIETWEPCSELKKAWELMDVETSDPIFLEKLVSHVQSLKNTGVENAWRALNFKYKLKKFDHMGEIPFQQFVYTPFAALFAAAGGGFEHCNYKADQVVSASLSVLCKDKEDDQTFEPKRITSMQGTAVTLSQGWDVFGMMALKRGQSRKQEAYFHDIDKCSVMTAVTAIIVGQFIDKDSYEEIAIPFLVGVGTMCSLYVTTLDKNGAPCIRLVKYPSNDLGKNNDLTTSSSKGRKNCFIALAVLLNKFKSIFETKGKKDYDEGLHDRTMKFQKRWTESLNRSR